MCIFYMLYNIIISVYNRSCFKLYTPNSVFNGNCRNIKPYKKIQKTAKNRKHKHRQHPRQFICRVIVSIYNINNNKSTYNIKTSPKI